MRWSGWYGMNCSLATHCLHDMHHPDEIVRVSCCIVVAVFNVLYKRYSQFFCVIFYFITMQDFLSENDLDFVPNFNKLVLIVTISEFD